MTGYTVHTGSTTKFSSNWDRIFSGHPGTSKKPSVKKPAKKSKKPRGR